MYEEIRRQVAKAQVAVALGEVDSNWYRLNVDARQLAHLVEQYDYSEAEVARLATEAAKWEELAGHQRLRVKLLENEIEALNRANLHNFPGLELTPELQSRGKNKSVKPGTL